MLNKAQEIIDEVKLTPKEQADLDITLITKRIKEREKND